MTTCKAFSALEEKGFRWIFMICRKWYKTQLIKLWHVPDHQLDPGLFFFYFVGGGLSVSNMTENISTDFDEIFRMCTKEMICEDVQDPGGWFKKKMPSYQYELTAREIMGFDCIGNPIMQIRRSYSRLISTMEFPLLVRWHLFIESEPWLWMSLENNITCMLN